jgi:hypothetical protein
MNDHIKHFSASNQQSQHDKDNLRQDDECEPSTIADSSFRMPSFSLNPFTDGLQLSDDSADRETVYETNNTKMASPSSHLFSPSTPLLSHRTPPRPTPESPTLSNSTILSPTAFAELESEVGLKMARSFHSAAAKKLYKDRHGVAVPTGKKSSAGRPGLAVKTVGGRRVPSKKTKARPADGVIKKRKWKAGSTLIYFINTIYLFYLRY